MKIKPRQSGLFCACDQALSDIKATRAVYQHPNTRLPVCRQRTLCCRSFPAHPGGGQRRAGGLRHPCGGRRITAVPVGQKVGVGCAPGTCCTARGLHSVKRHGAACFGGAGCFAMNLTSMLACTGQTAETFQVQVAQQRVRAPVAVCAALQRCWRKVLRLLPKCSNAASSWGEAA